MAHVKMVILLLVSIVTLFAKDIGNFTAGKNCVATKRIKDKRGISLTEGVTYKIIGINKKGGDYYYLQVGSQKRWVHKSCGNSSIVGKSTKKSNDCGTNYKGLVLAISWQPAFCETHRRKAECKNPCMSCFEARNFTLHGLWPNDVEYCCVSKKNVNLDKSYKWSSLPEPSLKAKTYKELEEVMPGVISNLHRHEWIKHGTCFGDAESYYRTSLDLLKKVNNSLFREAFVSFIGQRINRAEIYSLFDETFGKGASKALDIQCNKKGMLTELRIHLIDDLDMNKPFSQLLYKNRRNYSRCSNNIYIDPMGF